jgi:hypothetical protein
MPSKRRFFVVGWNRSLDFALYCDSDPTEVVSRWLEIIPTALNAQAGADGEKTEVLVPGETCLLFDWNLDELPAGIRVNQIPAPGVIFAVRKGSRLEGLPAADGSGSETDSGGEYALLYALKRELWRGDSAYAKRLQAFLTAPEAGYVPVPITRYDAFISYSSDDLALATEIAGDIEKRQMRTFMASRDLAAGTVWTEEVREALLASRALLIVLTPNSAARPWVMCEVGASWALGKPLLPALMYVDPKTLPEVITAYQGRRIETAQGRKELVDELAELCFPEL